MIELFTYVMSLPFIFNELLGTYETAIGISVVLFSILY